MHLHTKLLNYNFCAIFCFFFAVLHWFFVFFYTNYSTSNISRNRFHLEKYSNTLIELEMKRTYVYTINFFLSRFWKRCQIQRISFSVLANFIQSARGFTFPISTIFLSFLFSFFLYFQFQRNLLKEISKGILKELQIFWFLHFLTYIFLFVADLARGRNCITIILILITKYRYVFFLHDLPFIRFQPISTLKCHKPLVFVLIYLKVRLIERNHSIQVYFT